MAHFYGTVVGNRGEVTRCGGKASGVTTHAAGWRGAIEVTVFASDDGADCYEVTLVPWHGSGGSRQVLARGALDAQGETRPLALCDGGHMATDGRIN